MKYLVRLTPTLFLFTNHPSRNLCCYEGIITEPTPTPQDNQPVTKHSHQSNSGTPGQPAEVCRPPNIRFQILG